MSKLKYIQTLNHKISFNMLYFILNYKSIFNCVDLLQKAGAHYVIDTWEQMPDVIEDVNIRLGRGEKP